MAVTLIAGLMGFASSCVPELLTMWNEKHDRRHELAILDRQLLQQKHQREISLEAIHVESDLRESQALLKHDGLASGVRWIDGLRASVRPMITYAFFCLFALVKSCSLYVLMTHESLTFYEALPEIWDIETHALFSATLAYWFGSRNIAKLRRS